MAAPAAPVIRTRTNGVTVRVRWQPVATATDYKLYVGDTTGPTGLEADIPDDDMGSDGWFQYTFPEAGAIFIALTALNVIAEESDPSNEVRLELTGGGVRHTLSDPFGAYDERDG